MKAFISKRALVTLLPLALLAGAICACAPTATLTAAPPPSPLPTAMPTVNATVSPTAAPSSTPTARSIPTLRPWPTATPTEEGTPRYPGPGDYVDAIYVLESGEREFKLHIPPNYQPGTAMPLVLAFHGAGNDMLNLEGLSRMSLKADEAGFIVVYPQALASNQSWWYVPSRLTGDLDLVFIRQLIAHLKRELSIDPDRIYATGFSLGGGMAESLVCEMPDRIAAIAPVAAPFFFAQACTPGRPVPVLTFHGTNDDEVAIYEARRRAEVWAERNGCDLTPAMTYRQGRVTGETWENCDEGATVTLYTIEDGEHDWPGGTMDQLLHPGDVAISATNVIWEFFETHPMP